MTTVAHGPYEHVGAYANLAEPEQFDISDTPYDFCDYCEHAPCVAGGTHWCGQDPRFITVQAIEDEIHDLVCELVPADGTAKNRGLCLALTSAARGLTWSAWSRDGGASELRQLVRVRDYLRSAKENS